MKKIDLNIVQLNKEKEEEADDEAEGSEM